MTTFSDRRSQNLSFLAGLKHLACLFFLMMLSAVAFSQPVIPSTLVWDAAPHNAFTSLVRFEDNFYCAFREGLSHVDRNGGDDGRIRVLRSSDGHTWEPVALLSIKGKDLRDPSLSVTKNGKLSIAVCAAEYHPGATTVYHTYVANFRGRGFRKLSRVKTGLAREWLWKVHWTDDAAYSFSYTSGFRLMKSKRGRTFSTVCEYPLADSPSEADFCIDGQDFVVAVRRDKAPCLIGHGTLADGRVTWQESDVYFAGQQLLRLSDGRILLFARTKNATTGKRELAAFQYISQDLSKLATFPYRGDGGYFGAVETRDSVLVTYYSSHINNRAAIFWTSLSKTLLH